MFLEINWPTKSHSIKSPPTGSIGLLLAISFVLIGFYAVPSALAQKKTSTAALVPQTVFTNSSTITINDANPATPYPSNITVSGLSGTIPATAGSVKVTINGFSHTYPDDVGILLVGPTGAALLLQDGA